MPRKAPSLSRLKKLPSWSSIERKIKSDAGELRLTVCIWDYNTCHFIAVGEVPGGGSYRGVPIRWNMSQLLKFERGHWRLQEKGMKDKWSIAHTISDHIDERDIPFYAKRWESRNWDEHRDIHPLNSRVLKIVADLSIGILETHRGLRWRVEGGRRLKNVADAKKSEAYYTEQVAALRRSLVEAIRRRVRAEKNLGEYTITRPR